MHQTQTTKVAFIGAGDISLLHAEAVKACANTELIGLWNITDDLAQELAELRLGHLVEQQDGEFIAAKAGDDIGTTREIQEPAGREPEQLVAVFVSERVVDILETVEVDGNDRTAV